MMTLLVGERHMDGPQFGHRFACLFDRGADGSVNDSAADTHVCGPSLPLACDPTHVLTAGPGEVLSVLGPRHNAEVRPAIVQPVVVDVVDFHSERRVHQEAVKREIIRSTADVSVSLVSVLAADGREVPTMRAHPFKVCRVHNCVTDHLATNADQRDLGRVAFDNDLVARALRAAAPRPTELHELSSMRRTVTAHVWCRSTTDGTRAVHHHSIVQIP